MILLLLAAGAVTSLTGDHADTAIIAAVVLVNTTLGVVQERRGERAVRELDRLTSPWARVVRSGRAERVRADAVVPGDLLELEAGDVVAADGDLVLAHALQVDESAMTGESMPRSCAVGDVVESGSTVVRGRGRTVVTRTGRDSGLGRVAALMADSSVPATPLQRRLARLSSRLVVGVLVLAAVVLGE
jgi:Ca2+-transporting ATPase